MDLAQTSGVSPGSKSSPDFLVSSNSFPATIFLVTPCSKQAHSWLGENISDDAQWLGGGVVVENRYVAALLAGIRRDGLVVR